MVNRILLIIHEMRANPMEFNYLFFYTAIKAGAPSWWHYMSNVWIIKTTETARACECRLMKYISSVDNLFIIEIRDGDVGGWLPGDAWKWISDNTPLKVKH